MDTQTKPLLGLDLSLTGLRWSVGLAVVLVLFAALFSAVFVAYEAIYDDAFIYLRYARNIIDGCGPTYNCGTDSVEGFTSPLYQVLLTISYPLTDDGESLLMTWGLLGGWMALSLTCLFPAHYAASDKSSWDTVLLTLGATVVVCADSFIRRQMYSGMETWLAWLGFALIVHAALARRVYLTAAFVLAATLIRPEFFVFVPLLALFDEFRRLEPWAAVLGFFAVVLVARFAVFGDPLPNTFYVKSGGTFEHFMLGLDYLAGTVREFPVILLAPLVLVTREHRRASAFLLIGTAIWFLYQLRAGGDFYPHSRLLMPLIPGLVALALAGSYVASKRWLAHLAVPDWAKRFVVPGLVVALSLTTIALSKSRLLYIPPDPNRVDIWSEAGRWIDAELPENATVATVSIGAIGYYSDRTIVDMIGLTDPVIGREGDRVGEAYEYTPVGHETFNTAEVLRRRPDAIVFLQPAARSIVEQPTVVVGTPAEKELLEAIVRQKHDYVAVSREFLGGAHVVMLLRGGVADSIMPAQQVEPSSLEIDYRTPDDPYPNLP